ncbi:hypothetical protein J6590_014646 [Homalodisca vitripennis]|nr:hypothetical protein J6590_014646 [Homalodisca vitripennis]
MEKKPGVVKFEEAMEIAGFGKYSLFITFLSALTLFTSLLGSADVSFLMPAAECDLQLSSQDKGMLGSAFFMGMIAACHLSGFLSDTLGRRYVLVRGLSLNIFTYVLGAFSPNFLMLFILKVISGVLSCPTMIATIPFLGECVPSSKRAQSVLIATALSFTSLLFSSLVGWLTLTAVWEIDIWFVIFKPWRLFYLICGLPGCVCAVLYYIISESPRFMINRGRTEETMMVLQKIYKFNTGNSAKSYPVLFVTMDSEEVEPPVQGKGALGMLKHIYDQTSPLFKKPHVKNLILCVILMFVAFLSMNSILLWLPEVANRIAFSREQHEESQMMCQMVMVQYSANATTTEKCSEAIDTAVFLPNFILGIVFPAVMLSASTHKQYVLRGLGDGLTLVWMIPNGLGKYLSRGDTASNVTQDQ